MQVVLVRGGDDRGVIRVLQGLRRRSLSVGMLSDQGPRRAHGAPALFFEQPTWCHHGPVVLAQRAGVPIVPACCLRVGWDRFICFVGRPLHVQGRSATAALQHCMDDIASMIAFAPGQYFWQHRRFKYRAPGLSPRDRAPWRDRRRLVDPACISTSKPTTTSTRM